jgi:murein DD-endopeptidase MepM/ murein hydrolase activator NlpD
VDASLDRARTLSASLDSTLAILGRESARVEDIPTSYPVSPEAIVTREFGYSPDPFTGRKGLHAGVDFSMRAGAPVHAAGAGVVVEAGKDLLWGWFVRIDHGREVHSFYAHLEKVLVARGKAVARGDTVGLMGMTGVATGVHLHYELTIRGAKSDPLRFFLPDLVLASGAGTPEAGFSGAAEGAADAAGEGRTPAAAGADKGRQGGT